MTDAPHPLEQLLDRLRPSIVSFFSRRLTGLDRNLDEELAQDVLLKFFNSFDPARVSHLGTDHRQRVVFSYLWQIARTVLIDHHRALDHHRAQMMNPEVDPHEHDLRRIRAQLTEHEFLGILTSLPKETIQLLVLRLVDKLPFADITEELNRQRISNGKPARTESATRTRFMRARNKFGL